MIFLYQPPPPKWERIGNFSPFCLKLETWFRLTKTPYKFKRLNLRKSPKGKIPWIYDDQRDVTLGDTGLIIDDLKKTYNITIDDHLTSEQLATSVLLQRTIEEHLFFGVLYMRWSDAESMDFTRKFFKKLMPPLIGGIILKSIRQRVLKTAYSQGMGRHSRTDLEFLCRADLDAVAAILGDKTFIHGDAATTIDATLYGFLANLIWTPWDCELKTYALSKANLVAHCDRMHQIFVENAPKKS